MKDSFLRFRQTQRFHRLLKELVQRERKQKENSKELKRKKKRSNDDNRKTN